MADNIGSLDTAVQSALIADDPQQAVTDLVKRYASEMASELRGLTVYYGNCYMVTQVNSILDEWARYQGDLDETA